MSSNQPPQGPYGQQPPQGPYGPPTQQGQFGPPQGPPDGGWEQPDHLGGPPSGGGRTRGVAILASVAAIAVIGAGGVFAFQSIGGGGPRPADVMPGSAVAYAQIDLDPSAEQKVNMFRLLRTIPELEDELTSDEVDLRRLAFEEVLSDLDCDLTYDDDIEPWIGERAGISAVPVDDDTVIPVIAVQVSEEERAEDAVSTLEECSTTGALPEDIDGGAEGADVAVDFVGEYMILTEEEHIDDVVQESTDSPLADADGFSSDMDALDEPGLMSFWVDVPALIEIPEVAAVIESSGEDVSGFEEVDSAFGALRAGSDYIELVAFGRGESFELEVDGDNPVTELPETTLGAFSVSGGGAALDENWDDILSSLDSASGGQAQAEIDAFESETGFSVPEDISTLLGDNLTIALDSEGLNPDSLQSPSDIANLGFGARFTTDPDAITDLVDRIQSLLGEEGVPVELITRDVDDGLVLASNDDYADQLADGGSLGDSDVFQTAVPDASGSPVVFYLDLDALSGVAADFGAAEEMEELGEITAIGMSGTQDGDVSGATFRVVFGE